MKPLWIYDTRLTIYERLGRVMVVEGSLGLIRATVLQVGDPRSGSRSKAQQIRANPSKSD
jgi:hypothetical protein